MSFWVKRNQGTDFYIGDLSNAVVAASGGERDLHASFYYEDIVRSSDLATAFSSGNLVKIDGPGGSQVPSGQEYDDAVQDHTHLWEKVKVAVLGSATVDTLKEWLAYQETVNLAGDPYSDFIITASGSTAINISAGKLFIKTSNSYSGDIVAYDYPGESAVALPYANAVNWVYMDYNGGSPQVAVTDNLMSLNLNTQVVIGRVYRYGSELRIFNVGQRFSNYRTRDCFKDFEVYGPQRASGLLLGESGTRNVTMSAGVFYCAHNRESLSALDTSGTDHFDVWNSSASTTPDASAVSQIDNQQYWNGGALADLGNNNYGVRFMYVDFDGHLHMQYGTSNANTVAEAGEETIPTPPAYLRDFAVYIGRIIIQEDGTSFSLITNPFEMSEEGAGVTSHDELNGVTANQHHNQQHSITSTSDHTFPGGTSTYLRADGSFATPSGGAADEIAIYADHKTAGSDGGDFNSGSWVTRTLNTTEKQIVTNSNISRVGNVITLKTGKYKVRAWAQAYGVDKHMTRLRKTSGTASTAVNGMTAFAGDFGAFTGYCGSHSMMEGVVEVTGASDTFELQHRCINSKSLDGLGLGDFGYGDDFGEDEVFSRVVIEKVKE